MEQAESSKIHLPIGNGRTTGAFIAFLLLRPIINDLVISIIFAMVTGIMLYIAIEELLHLPAVRPQEVALISTFAES